MTTERDAGPAPAGQADGGSADVTIPAKLAERAAWLAGVFGMGRDELVEAVLRDYLDRATPAFLRAQAAANEKHDARRRYLKYRKGRKGEDG
jgi:hypothetical protein